VNRNFLQEDRYFVKGPMACMFCTECTVGDDVDLHRKSQLFIHEFRTSWTGLEASWSLLSEENTKANFGYTMARILYKPLTP